MYFVGAVVAAVCASLFFAASAVLELRGDAEVTPDDDYSFADKVGAKYHADLRQHDQPGQSRVKVVIRPVRVNAVDMRG